MRPELMSAKYALSVNHCGLMRRLKMPLPANAYGSVTRNATKAPTRATPNEVRPSSTWLREGRPLRGHTNARPRTGSNVSALTLHAVASPAMTPARSASHRLSRCQARWPKNRHAAANGATNVSTVK
jgi:hypothetical protein